MFNRKKSKCRNCNSSVDDKFSFCPFCGASLYDVEKDKKEYGLLGKSDNDNLQTNPFQNFGITDKFIGSIMNSLIKTLDKKFKDKGFEEDSNKTEIKSFPNGIRIKIGSSNNKKPSKGIYKKVISEQQLEKISKLPKKKANVQMKRLSDRIVYEMDAKGIESPQDVFISKLEFGYEVKAIGSKKVYINSLPINLPLKGFSVNNKKLCLEFKTE